MDMTVGGHPGSRPPRHLMLLGAVIGFCVALVLAVSGAWALGMFGSFGAGSSSSDRRVAIQTEHLALTMTVPGDLGILEVHTGPAPDAELDCQKLRYAFGTALSIEAFARDCRTDDSQSITNGNHGDYRTLDDVPDPIDVHQISTHAGPAEVFTQKYTEYTNDSTTYVEPVAIVTFDQPTDPDFPTLVLRSSKGALPLEDFTEIVSSLSVLDHQIA